MKLDSIAIFLDFDGTLVEFAPSPDAVEVSPKLQALMQSLAEKLQGAIAIVTGRDYESLQSLFKCEQLVVACEHGSEIHWPDSIADDSEMQKVKTQVSEIDEPHEKLVEKINAYADKHELQCENKNLSATLHYRDKAGLESQILNFAEALADSTPSVSVLHGKFVVEIKFDDRDKGSAIRSMMEVAPFKNRTPIFLGDDVTDEHGFKEINARGGLSFKVGDGDTSASRRLKNVGEVHKFLEQLLETGELI